MRLGRRFLISVPVKPRALQSNWIELSESVLAAAGFRDIVLSESEVHGTRGGQWHGLAISVEPRRHHHRLHITERGVTYAVRSRLPVIFSSADQEVFKAEGRKLLAMLSGAPAREDELQLALAKQRLADKKLLTVVLLVTVLFAIALGIILEAITWD